jgi:ABC-2 type transport system ATP-binding protein
VAEKGEQQTAAATLPGVTMRFGDNKALDDVSAVIEQDSIAGLPGRNGAGKTTPMQLLTEHREPTSGRVEVFGGRSYENDAVPGRTAFIKEVQRYPDSFRLCDAVDAPAILFPSWDDETAGVDEACKR